MRRSLAAIALAGALVAGCGGGGEPEGTPLPEDVGTILTASAEAMGDVSSVRFDLKRAGTTVFIDQFESIALDRIVGRYAAPGSVDAALTVTVDGNLKTKLGAVAIGDEVWLSNPVTGKFETLPEGYDIDPSSFFDPDGAWRPLMAELQGAQLIGVEDRGGKRYHVRGVAPADRIEAITAGLVDDQDVTMDFWLRRDTGLVTAAEFSTSFGDGTIEWTLQLKDYGTQFTIEAPDVDG